MKHYINDKFTLQGNFEDKLLEAISICCEDYFDDVLDTGIESFKIAGVEFYPSDILKRLEPKVYVKAFNNYVDDVFQETINDLNRGDKFYINGLSFKIAK